MRPTAISVLLLAACSSPHRSAPARRDATYLRDSSLAPDSDGRASKTDTSSSDTSQSGTSKVDTPKLDTHTSDASAPDTYAPDASQLDASQLDASQLDTNTSDSSELDTSSVDASVPDAVADAASEATSCFVGAPPGPIDKVLQLPKPKTACPAYDDPFIGSPGDPLGKATLKVEIGAADPSTGHFVPYKDGDFVPIRPGAQPGFHVWAAFRVHLPGQSAAKVQLEAQSRGLYGCKLTCLGALPNYYAAKDPEVAGAYSYQSKLAPGMTCIFQQTEIWMSPQWCGKWFDLRVQVRDVKGQKWGRGQVLLRIWDGVVQN